MSHDTVVSWAFEGSFRKKERDRLARREEGQCRKVGGLEKKKRCSADSFAVCAFAAPGCNHSNFVLVLKCNGHVSV